MPNEKILKEKNSNKITIISLFNWVVNIHHSLKAFIKFSQSFFPGNIDKKKIAFYENFGV